MSLGCRVPGLDLRLWGMDSLSPYTTTTRFSVISLIAVWKGWLGNPKTLNHVAGDIATWGLPGMGCYKGLGIRVQGYSKRTWD